MLRKTIGLVFVLLLCLPSALMQDAEPSPEIIIYGVDTGTAASVITDQLTTLATLRIPAVMNHNIPDPYPWSYVLSPDQSKLVFEFTERSGTTYYVADLTTGHCCLKLDPQDKEMNSRGPGFPAFSPDSTQVAVDYTNSTYQALPQVVVYNVNTGAVIDRLRTPDAPPLDTGDDPVQLLVIDWTADGVGVIPVACCQSPTQGELTRWIPQEDVNQPATFASGTETFDLTKETLGTGESISVGLDVLYPSAFADGLYVPSNVVIYQAPSEAPHVIYVNPTDTGIGGANWVADGQAILITRVEPEEGKALEEAVLLRRDGTQLPMSFVYGETFLAATSDGWITRGINNGELIAYHLSDEISQTPIGKFERRMVVLYRSELGQSLEDAEPFPEVPAP
jgi:hypothetical protein